MAATLVNEKSPIRYWPENTIPLELGSIVLIRQNNSDDVRVCQYCNIVYCAGTSTDVVDGKAFCDLDDIQQGNVYLGVDYGFCICSMSSTVSVYVITKEDLAIVGAFSDCVQYQTDK